VQALYDDDLADGGHVWNVSRLWAHQPETVERLFELMSAAFRPSGLSFRQRGILVIAAASALGDSSKGRGQDARKSPQPRRCETGRGRLRPGRNGTAFQQVRRLPLGAGDQDRTGDLPFTRRPLCLLSYTGGDFEHGSRTGR
jgi:hypothetical protein